MLFKVYLFALHKETQETHFVVTQQLHIISGNLFFATTVFNNVN